MAKNYDAIIIGAGQSGPFLAVRLAEAGQNVALIEREHIGGTCVNNGCIPTKTMVASARAALRGARGRTVGRYHRSGERRLFSGESPQGCDRQ